MGYTYKSGLTENPYEEQAGRLKEGFEAQLNDLFDLPFVRDCRIMSELIEVDYTETAILWRYSLGQRNIPGVGVRQTEKRAHFAVEPLTLGLALARRTSNSSAYGGFGGVLMKIRYTHPNNPHATRKLHPHMFHQDHICLNQWTSTFKEVINKGNAVGLVSTFWMFINNNSDSSSYMESYCYGREPLSPWQHYYWDPKDKDKNYYPYTP